MRRSTATSLLPRNARTLALHMAMEAAQRAEVGQRIRELRGPATQQYVADKIGVTLRAYQAWEGGESAPQWDNLVRLSKHFGVTQDFLLYGEAHNQDDAGADSRLDRLDARLDRIEALLTRVVSTMEGFDVTDATEAITQFFEAELEPVDASEQPDRQTSPQPDAKPVPLRAGSRGRR